MQALTEAALFASASAAILAWQRLRTRRQQHQAALAAAPALAVAADVHHTHKHAVGHRKIIVEPSVYERTVEAIVAGGADELMLILDFDRTISTFWYDRHAKERSATCHGIVESTRGPELLERAHRLNQKYYPLEVDPGVPIELKIPLMEEWYTAVHELLMQDGLVEADVVASVAAAKLRLRQGVEEVFKWADAHGVPLLVFSAGLGNVLAEVLRQRLPGGLPKCVHVVSNMMEFDAAGTLTGFTGLIHMFNKHAGVLDPATLRALSSRPHVIVVGDSLGDATMAQGLPSIAHELRIGLLNDGEERLLPQYEEAFDVVLTDDAPLGMLVDLLHRVAPGQ